MSEMWYLGMLRYQAGKWEEGISPNSWLLVGEDSAMAMAIAETLAMSEMWYPGML
jgi:hypothetical protein